MQIVDTLSSTIEVSASQQQQIVVNKSIIKGKLTSQIWTRKSSDTPYYAFIRSDDNQKHSRTACERMKCRDCEIPVIFRLSNPIKPQLEKNNQVILKGKWANPTKSSCHSFTCYSYQLL